MDKKQNSKIFLTGHKGMVGASIYRHLDHLGYKNILTRSKEELDLRNQAAVNEFFRAEKPEYLFIIAAKVGGISANMKYPADFLYDNLMIQANLIQSAYETNVKKIVFLGSSCIYPKDCPQPMKEEFLLTGPLEPTNEGYAIAKIAGIKLLEYFKKQRNLDYLSIMPSNLYGPGDSFHPEHSHVLSANVKRFVDAVHDGAKEVTMWGTGVAKREFLHVDDLARILLELFDKDYNVTSFINIGTGKEISIKELAIKIADFSGYKGKIHWDASKPDGMLRKCMDVGKMNALGLSANISLDEGILELINIYKESKQGQKK